MEIEKKPKPFQYLHFFYVQWSLKSVSLFATISNEWKREEWERTHTFNTHTLFLSLKWYVCSLKAKIDKIKLQAYDRKKSSFNYIWVLLQTIHPSQVFLYVCVYVRVRVCAIPISFSLHFNSLTINLSSLTWSNEVNEWNMKKWRMSSDRERKIGYKRNHKKCAQLT